MSIDHKVEFSVKWYYKLQFNYGGIRAKFQTGSPITNTEGDSQVEIVACWNMAEHLTKDIQVCYSSGKVISFHVNKMSVKVAQMYCDIENHPNNLWLLKQALFHLRVSEFLYDPWVYLQKQISSRTTTDDSTCTPSITVTAAETLEDCINDHIRKRVNIIFTSKRVPQWSLLYAVLSSYR